MLAMGKEKQRATQQDAGTTRKRQWVASGKEEDEKEVVDAE